MADQSDGDRGFHLRPDADGIVRLSWAPGVHITGALATAAMSAVDRVNVDHGRPLLVDMSGIASLAREARSVFTCESSVTRIAIVGVSSVDRVIATFGLRLSNPPTPARFFTSTPDALTWLHSDDD